MHWKSEAVPRAKPLAGNSLFTLCKPVGNRAKAAEWQKAGKSPNQLMASAQNWVLGNDGSQLSSTFSGIGIVMLAFVY
jgi:hypothetical protein